MTRRRRFRVIAIAIALLGLASVSIDRGRTLQILDMTGAPVEDVLVVYHHEGSRPNPAHTASYQASNRSVIEGSAGRVRIPPSLHAHWPFPIETNPGVRVDLVYVPALHNGWATIVDRPVAMPGIFSVAGDLATVRLADLSVRPDLWQGTLMNMSSIISQLLAERTSPPRRRKARPGTTALTRVLVGNFSREYSAFLDRYRDVPRPRPEMPPAVRFSTDEERRAWEAMVDRDLAREPLWGDAARRMFGRDVEQFFAAELNLR